MTEDDDLVDCDLFIASPTSDPEAHHLTDSPCSSGEGRKSSRDSSAEVRSVITPEEKVNAEKRELDEEAEPVVDDDPIEGSELLENTENPGTLAAASADIIEDDGNGDEDDTLVIDDFAPIEASELLDNTESPATLAAALASVVDDEDGGEDGTPLVDVSAPIKASELLLNSENAGTLAAALVPITDDDEGGEAVRNALALFSENTIRRGTLSLPLQKLFLRLRSLGCVIDVVQAKLSKRKIRCFVDGCTYNRLQPENIGFRCTLPSNVEAALQWICICVSDIGQQNTLIIKFINSLHEDEEAGQILNKEVAPSKKLYFFPFRICSHHFDPRCADLPTALVPSRNLPKKPFFSRDELLLRLRRRYVFLSEMGYEDIDIDKLEPTGVLVNPLKAPLSCCVPGCNYKSCDISLFSGKYIKMYSIPSNGVDYKKWCKAVQDGLNLPNAFELRLPAKAHICEMHFAEGKRYTKGVMQDPTVFRKLAPPGVSSVLSRLGPLRITTCAVARCSNVKTGTLCIPFPRPDDNLHNRWIESLKKYDESFAYDGSKYVCLKHFSLAEESGVVPVLCLDGDSESDSVTRASSKRTHEDDAGPENFEEPAKRSRVDSHENTDRLHSNDGQTELENSCCAETLRISEIVEQIERKTLVVESVIEQLQITCKNYYKEKGELNQHFKFQLFDILSELKSQKGIVHSLRLRLEDTVKVPERERLVRWTID